MEVAGKEGKRLATVTKIVDGDLGCDGEVFFRRTLSQLNCNLGPCLLKCNALT